MNKPQRLRVHYSVYVKFPRSQYATGIIKLMTTCYLIPRMKHYLFATATFEQIFSNPKENYINQLQGLTSAKNENLKYIFYTPLPLN